MDGNKKKIVEYLLDKEDHCTFAKIANNVLKKDDPFYEESELRSDIRQLVKDGYIIHSDENGTDFYIAAETD